LSSETFDLDTVFRPQSIAVVGATRNPNKWGFQLLNSILAGGYQGALYPVHPHEEILSGLKGYPGLSAIGHSVDLVVVAVPAVMVPDVITEAGRCGASAALIITSGFEEAGDHALAARTLAIAQESGIRIVGPNGMGVFCLASRLCAMMVPVPMRSGDIAFISQSGGYGVQLFLRAQRLGLGVHSYVSSGNEMDLTCTDYLAYFGADPDIRAVIMYIEGLHPNEGPRFIETAREVVRCKPVIAVKVGVTAEGARAASSHTGAMVGNDSIYEAALRQAGVLRAEDAHRLFDWAKALTRLPLPRDNRMGILTRSGGAAVAAADRCGLRGLEVPPLSQPARQRIEAYIPPYATAQNPVDVTGDIAMEAYNKSLPIMLEEEHLSGLIAVAVSNLAIPGLEEVFPYFHSTIHHGMSKTCDLLVDLMKRHGKPIVVESVTEYQPLLQELDARGVPVYPTPERTVDAMAALVQYKHYRDRVEKRSQSVELPVIPGHARVHDVIEQHQEAGYSSLTQAEAQEILRAYEIPMPAAGIGHTPEEAVALAGELGYPVAMKVVTRSIMHKTDVGGVALNLRDPQAVREAFAQIDKSVRARESRVDIEGMLVQAMVAPGTEVIVGMKRDVQFGPVLMVGLGGVFAEVLKDVALRVAPVNSEDALEMMQELRAYPLLAGARGGAPADLEALALIMERVSRLALDCPQIVELDLNPVIVHRVGQGAIAVDALLVLNQPRFEDAGTTW